MLLQYPEVSGGISLPVLPSLALGSLFLAALGAVPLGMSRRRIGFGFRVGYLRLLLLVALVPDYPGSLAGDCHGVLPLRLSPGFLHLPGGATAGVCHLAGLCHCWMVEICRASRWTEKTRIYLLGHEPRGESLLPTFVGQRRDHKLADLPGMHMHV